MTRSTMYLSVVLLCAGHGCAASPDVDLDQERSAAAQVEMRYVSAVNEGNLDALVELYAPDARVAAAGSPVAQGHDAIRQHFSQLLGAPGIEVSATSDRVTVSRIADMAVDAGRYRFSFEGPDGPISGTGRYLLVLRKFEGAWKIVENMDYNAVE